MIARTQGGLRPQRALSRHGSVSSPEVASLRAQAARRSRCHSRGRRGNTVHQQLVGIDNQDDGLLGPSTTQLSAEERSGRHRSDENGDPPRRGEVFPALRQHVDRRWDLDHDRRRREQDLWRSNDRREEQQGHSHDGHTPHRSRGLLQGRVTRSGSSTRLSTPFRRRGPRASWISPRATTLFLG